MSSQLIAKARSPKFSTHGQPQGPLSGLGHSDEAAFGLGAPCLPRWHDDSPLTLPPPKSALVIWKPHLICIIVVTQPDPPSASRANLFLLAFLALHSSQHRAPSTPSHPRSSGLSMYEWLTPTRLYSSVLVKAWAFSVCYSSSLLQFCH